MKTKDVPQDDAGFLKEGKVRDVCYALDENGKYIQVLSVGWDPKNDAIKQAWGKIYLEAEKTKEKVLQGKLSPLAYHMKIKMMKSSLLAKYTGFSLFQIWQHRKPKGFKKLTPAQISIYADALNITPEQLILL